MCSHEHKSVLAVATHLGTVAGEVSSQSGLGFAPPATTPAATPGSATIGAPLPLAERLQEVVKVVGPVDGLWRRARPPGDPSGVAETFQKITIPGDQNPDRWDSTFGKVNHLTTGPAKVNGLIPDGI